MVITSAIQTVLCFVSVVVIGPWPLVHMGDINTPLHTDILVFILGCHCFELLWGLWWQFWKKNQIPTAKFCHHLTVIFPVAYFLHQNTNADEMLLAIAVGISTVPLVHFLWLLKKSGFYNNYSFALTMDSIFFTLSAIRHIAFIAICAFYTTHEEVSSTIKIDVAIFYIVNLIIFLQLCAYMYRRHIRRDACEINHICTVDSS